MAIEKEINIKRDWKLIDEMLSVPFQGEKELVELKVGSDKLEVVHYIHKNRVVYLVFVNNKLRYKESKYMNEHIRFVYHKKDRESARKKYIKYHGKVKGLKEYEASMWNDKITTYNVIFTSKLSIKKMLERQTEKIFIIGVE